MHQFFLLVYPFLLILDFLAFPAISSFLPSLSSFWLPSVGMRDRNQVRWLFFASLYFPYLIFLSRWNKTLASNFFHIAAFVQEVRQPHVRPCFSRAQFFVAASTQRPLASLAILIFTVASSSLLSGGSICIVRSIKLYD